MSGLLQHVLQHSAVPQIQQPFQSNVPAHLSAFAWDRQDTPRKEQQRDFGPSSSEQIQAWSSTTGHGSGVDLIMSFRHSGKYTAESVAHYSTRNINWLSSM